MSIALHFGWTALDFILQIATGKVLHKKVIISIVFWGVVQLDYIIAV